MLAWPPYYASNLLSITAPALPIFRGILLPYCRIAVLLYCRIAVLPIAALPSKTFTEYSGSSSFSVCQLPPPAGGLDRIPCSSSLLWGSVVMTLTHLQPSRTCNPQHKWSCFFCSGQCPTVQCANRHPAPKSATKRPKSGLAHVNKKRKQAQQ